MPDFPLVDAHVHLYDPGVIRYGWMADKPVLQGPHLLAELDRASAPVEVEGIVFVEVGADPGQYLQEASFIDGLAARDPRIRGMVAHCGPCRTGFSVIQP